jgi:hypothetical protein
MVDLERQVNLDWLGEHEPLGLVEVGLSRVVPRLFRVCPAFVPGLSLVYVFGWEALSRLCPAWE